MGVGWVIFRLTTLQGSLEITKDPLVRIDDPPTALYDKKL